MRRSRRFPLPHLLLAAAAATSACRPQGFLRTGGPFTDNDAPHEGIRYYVAKDLLLLEVRHVKMTKKQWTQDSAGVACVARTTDSSDTPLVATSIQTVADRQHAFRLAMKPSGGTRQSMTVSVSESGLLTGINHAAEDKRFEIAGNALRVVAGIAGTALGLGQLFTWNPPEVPTGIEKADTSDKLTKPRVASNEVCFLQNAPAAQKLKGQLDSLDKLATELAAERLQIIRRGPGSRTTADLALLRAKDGDLARVLDQLAYQYSTTRAALTAGADAFARAAGVGTKVDTTPPRKYAFDVGLLPDKPVQPQSGDPQALVFAVDNLVIAADDPPASARTVAFDASDTTHTSLSCSNPSPVTCARIQYRMPRLHQVTIFSVERRTAPVATNGMKASEVPGFKAVESTMMLLASSADPILNIGFDAKKLGSGSVKLAFGKYGNVTSIEQVTEATAANGSAALVKALADSRTDFLDGIKTVAESQKGLIGIEEAGRAARVKELQDQKSVLDAELAVQGAKAGSELVLQTKKIEAELALLTAQQNLATKSATPNPMQAELDALKVQLELLKTQLEVEKMKRELDAAKRPPTPSPER